MVVWYKSSCQGVSFLSVQVTDQGIGTRRRQAHTENITVPLTTHMIAIDKKVENTFEFPVMCNAGEVGKAKPEWPYPWFIKALFTRNGTEIWTEIQPVMATNRHCIQFINSDRNTGLIDTMLKLCRAEFEINLASVRVNKALLCCAPCGKSAGVAPEVNLRITTVEKACKPGIHPGCETPGRCHQKIKTWASSYIQL